MRNTYCIQKLKRLSQVINSYIDLSSYSNKHKGERCFIIGNGPSLNKTNLKLLKNEYTFGLNRIYLNHKNMGFEPNFLVSINNLVLSQFKKDLKGLKSIKFFSSSAKQLFKGQKDTHFLHLLNDPKFHNNPYIGLWTGHTVTFVAMQLAYFMGFEKVYLVGVDHSFKTKGSPNETQKLTSDDPNHFSKEYFKGYQWQLPDLKKSEMGYKLAKKAFHKDSREIQDATIGGSLTIFEKIDYNSLFKDK